MPAIRPALLKQQVALVTEHYNDPHAYVRSLGHLFDIYADRVQRPGQSGKPRPLLPSYRVRPPVLRQVLWELAQHVEAEPVQALALCDLLWEQPNLEFRQIAIGLLGQIPTNPVDPLLNRLNSWQKNAPERSLIDFLLSQGAIRLCKEKPQIVTDLAESWLEDSDQNTQQAGLRLLLPLAKDSTFTNLPVLFRLLQPWVGAAPEPLRPDLLDILESLGRRSGQETAHFLRQSLNLPNRNQSAWVIRQLLPIFPEDIQASLRSALRAAKETNG